MIKSLVLGVGLLFASVQLASAQLVGPPINYSGGVGSGGSGSCTGAFCAATAPLSAALGGNGLDNSAATGIPLWTAGTQSILTTSGTGSVARVTSPTVSGLTASGTTTFSGITGSTQCLHVNTSGVLSGSGSDCGAGGSVSITSASAGLVVTPSPLTGTGTVGLTNSLNEQSSTTYLILAGDATKLVSTTNAATVNVTLPNATGSFAAGFGYNTYNYGAGNQVITPTTATISGKATLTLGLQQGASIFSNVGGNYGVILGLPQVASDALLLNSTASTDYPVATGVPGCANDGAHGLVFVSHAFACANISGGVASAITVGTTTVGSGTTTRVLFNNAGVLGEYVISGTGNVAMTASPTFTGTITAAATTLSGTLTTNLTGGGTQCVQASNTGVLSGTGSACGGGSSSYLITFSGNASGTPGAAGNGVAFATATLTDNNTAVSGTAPLSAFIGVATPTFAATNATVTTTHASTVRIAGVPIAGTNNTLTAVSAFSIAAGDSVMESPTAKFRMYNVGSPGATNSEEGDIGFATNVWTFSTAKTGTGTLRGITFSPGGNLVLNPGSGGQINFQVAGSAGWSMDNASFTSANANGARITQAASSSTVPTLLPNKASTNTGFGAQASGNISCIVGGVEICRISATALTQIAGLTVLKSYTIAGLPTGITGGMAYVTDASVCTFLTTVVGGGATTCPVFYDGTTYKAF